MFFLLLFWWLVAAHALCDFPLQGDFLARAKNHKQPLPGVPWWIALVAHSLIHGAAVAFITGSVGLGLAETLLHAFIDHGKSGEHYDFAVDQAFHVVTKALWAALALL